MSTEQLVAPTTVVDNQQVQPQTQVPQTDNVVATAKTDQFFVRTLAGKTLVFSHTPDTTIEAIKNRIHELEHISVDQQRLVFNGKQLDDKNKLSDYAIQPEATIHLILRLRGGDKIVINVNFYAECDNY